MVVALFPGQGVQSPGMGTGLPEASTETFATASDVLGIDTIQLCRDGASGEATLESTRWAQPAVLVCSVAAYRALSDQGHTFAATTGHSVGEYAALVAGGALSLEDALRLVAIRAEATEDAAKLRPGAMAAVMKVERAQVEDVCSVTGVALAADNGPGQLVISGPSGGIDAAIDGLTELGAKCRRIDVAGAFHSPCMEPAIERLRAALDEIEFNEPTLQVWSPTSAGPVATATEIRGVLLDALTNPVRWRETVEGLARSIGHAFYDLGPGRVVAGLVKRIVDGADIKTTKELAPA